MSEKPSYTASIDAMIYGRHTENFGPGDWIELAIAALDQAGLSAETQEQIRRATEEALGER